MMLITPYFDICKYKNIPGIPSCVGIDMAPIKAEELCRCEGRHVCTWSEQERLIPKRAKVKENKDGKWLLSSSTTYLFTLAEVEIPSDCYGLLFPRSTAIRMGMFFTPSAVWDPGFKGHGVCLVYCTLPVRLAVGVPIATLMLWQEDGMLPYAGRYMEG